MPSATQDGQGKTRRRRGSKTMMSICGTLRRRKIIVSVFELIGWVNVEDQLVCKYTMGGG